MYKYLKYYEYNVSTFQLCYYNYYNYLNCMFDQTSLECSDKSIGSTVITPVNQEDNGYNHDWIKDNDEKIINTRPKVHNIATISKITILLCVI